MDIKLVAAAAVILLAPGASGCSFMGDVLHAEGEYSHRIGDAFKRQAARREAAKTRAAKKSKTTSASAEK